MAREALVNEFYKKLRDLNEVCGGKRKLKNCDGRMDWPNRGIYFFFEKNEFRKNGKELRVNRIGTHTIKEGSKAKLWID